MPPGSSRSSLEQEPAGREPIHSTRRITWSGRDAPPPRQPLQAPSIVIHNQNSPSKTSCPLARRHFGRGSCAPSRPLDRSHLFPSQDGAEGEAESPAKGQASRKGSALGPPTMPTGCGAGLELVVVASTGGPLPRRFTLPCMHLPHFRQGYWRGLRFLVPIPMASGLVAPVARGLAQRAQYRLPRIPSGHARDRLYLGQAGPTYAAPPSRRGRFQWVAALPPRSRSLWKVEPLCHLFQGSVPFDAR